MKSIPLSILYLILCSFFACKNPPHDITQQISQRWKIEEVTSPRMTLQKDSMIVFYQNLPDSIRDLINVDSIIHVLEDAEREIYKNSYLNIKSDGNYELALDEISEKGTWSILNDSTLEFIQSGVEQDISTMVRIKDLTNNSISLMSLDPDDTITMKLIISK